MRVAYQPLALALLTLHCVACSALLGDPFDGLSRAPDASAVQAQDGGQPEPPASTLDADAPDEDSGLDASIPSHDRDAEPAREAPPPDAAMAADAEPEEPLDLSPVIYHGLRAAEHTARVTELKRKGFRISSLSVAGDPNDARYAAVWLHRAGPDWEEAHGLSADQLSARTNELSAKNYQMTRISVTGGRGSEVFAAVYELEAETRARWALSWCNAGQASCDDTIQTAHNQARADDFIPISVAIYGDAEARRYAAVWARNSEHASWSSWSIPGDWFERFDAQLVHASARPALLSLAQDGTLASIYRDDELPSWEARRDLDDAGLDAELDAQRKRGRHPIALAAGGYGADLRYAVVFAEQETTTARIEHVAPPETSAAGSGELDDALLSFMKARGIRAGTIAMAREGDVRFARGYTWAEAHVPITQPETRFRIESVSAVFTAAEISALVRAGRLTWSTPALAAAGVGPPLPASAVVDPRLAEITTEQLVRRTSLLPIDFGDTQRNIARKLGITSAPLTRKDLLGYLSGLPLLSAPGGHSDAAEYVLTSLIESVTGLPYLEALERDVLAPLGIEDVSVGATRMDARQAGEVSRYDSAWLSDSWLDFTEGALAPSAYGGRFVLETAEGALGLVTSAPTLAKLIGHHPAWAAPVGDPDASDLERRAPGPAAAYGFFDGTTAIVINRMDGTDIAFLFNRQLSGADIAEIRGRLEAWADTWRASL